MSVLPISELPPEPTPRDDDDRLTRREFPTAVDPALIDRCPADPSTVHIAPKRRAA